MGPEGASKRCWESGWFGARQRMDGSPRLESWGDCLEMVQNRHKDVSTDMVRALRDHTPGIHVQGTAPAGPQLEELAVAATDQGGSTMRTRPFPNISGHFGTQLVNAKFLQSTVCSRLSDTSWALLRFWSGPMASVLVIFARQSRFDVLVPRSPPPPFVAPSSLVQPCSPVWPSTRSPVATLCCGGGSWVARFRSGVRSRSRLSRGRVTTNIRIQGLVYAVPIRLDERRVVVSVLRRDGALRPRCADVDGVVLEAARRRKLVTLKSLEGTGEHSWWSLRQRCAAGDFVTRCTSWCGQGEDTPQATCPEGERSACVVEALEVHCRAGFALSLLERRDSLGSDVVGASTKPSSRSAQRTMPVDCRRPRN